MSTRKASVMTIIPFTSAPPRAPDLFNGAVIDVSTAGGDEPALAMGNCCVSLIMIMLMPSLDRY